MMEEIKSMLHLDVMTVTERPWEKIWKSLRLTDSTSIATDI